MSRQCYGAKLCIYSEWYTVEADITMEICLNTLPGPDFDLEC